MKLEDVNRLWCSTDDNSVGLPACSCSTVPAAAWRFTRRYPPATGRTLTTTFSTFLPFLLYQKRKHSFVSTAQRREEASTWVHLEYLLVRSLTLGNALSRGCHLPVNIAGGAKDASQWAGTLGWLGVLLSLRRELEHTASLWVQSSTLVPGEANPPKVQRSAFINFCVKLANASGRACDP